MLQCIFVFRYKKFKLGADIELVVRCEHDAVTQGPSGELAYMNVKSLNEWDSKVTTTRIKFYSSVQMTD